MEVARYVINQLQSSSRTNWIKDWNLSSAGNSAKFEITDAKLHVLLVTLSTKDNVNLTKQLSNEFKRSVYWNKYPTIPAKVINNGTNIYELLSASFQGVKRLFALAYDATDNDDSGVKSNRKYFLPRAEIKSYNVLIDRRNFYDQSSSDLIKQYDEVRKMLIRKDDDYTIRCLLDYTYLKDNWKLITNDLSKLKALDADQRAIPQIGFQGIAG